MEGFYIIENYGRCIWKSSSIHAGISFCL